jgi:hypothetical protein
MLGNDVLGDCAIAGPCHQTMLWAAEAGTPAPFDDKAAISNYQAVSGYNPANPDTDQGCAIDDVARYWRNTGMIDAAGNRHKIVAYLDLAPGDIRELWTALWLFQSVGMGFALPDTAIQQTQQGQIWDVVPHAHIVGGHYVPAVARPASSMGLGITWGAKQFFTARFYQRYSNQGIVALSEEMMVKGKSIDGFDDATLREDLHAITRR